MKVICLIPVFNNALTIAEVVGKCRRLDMPVVVVNDGSTDESAEAARKAGATVVSFTKNRGKGAALLAGFSYILREHPDADLVVTLDADGQHDPADIPRLLDAARGGNSLVIGSRVEDAHEMPLVRRIANRAVSGLVSWLVGEQVVDTQSGFRVFPARFLGEKKFSQARYGIETEMLFAAESVGLGVIEVPIKTVYPEKSNFYPLKDLTNVCDILAVSIVKGVPAALRRGGSWKTALAAALVAAAMVAQFGAAFHPLERARERGIPLFSKLTPGPAVQEKIAVFEWLSANTPHDAIIFAPRFEAHRIMALADRRAIVSSKVYPSESADVAARIRDTARFFFATDPQEAQRVLAKYGASYVLVPRMRDWFGICREISVCHWVTVGKNNAARRFNAGDLTPEGKQRTVVGKLLSGAEIPFLQKIWESPSYLAYRVIGASPQAECELTPTERQAIADFALGRSGADESVFGRQCGISVALWQDGVRRFAGKNDAVLPLAEGIRRALADYLGDPAEAEAAEFTVYDSMFARFTAGSFVARRGAVLEPQPVFFSDAELRSRIRLALDWLLVLERPDGTFRQFVDPADIGLQEDEPRDIAIDALGAWALAEGYAAFRDARYFAAARRGVEAVEAGITSGNPVRTNALSFALMARIRLLEATGDNAHRIAASRHRELLRSLTTSSHWTPEVFSVREGRAAPVGREYTRIATHIAFWALVRWQYASGQSPPEELREFADELRHRFLTNRIVKRDLNLAETARLANAFATLSKIAPAGGYDVVAGQIARWLADFQYLDMPAERDGAFPTHPETSVIDTNSVARTAEGLAVAGAGFREIALRGLSWLGRMQYDNESLYFVPPAERGLLIGGLRAGPSSALAPLGAAAHFVLSGLWYLEP